MDMDMNMGVATANRGRYEIHTSREMDRIASKAVVEQWIWTSM